jgi:hypothetical protein
MDYAAKAVLGELEEVRAVITRPENIFIHMAANLDTLAALGEYGTAGFMCQVFTRLSLSHHQFSVSASILYFLIWGFNGGEVGGGVHVFVSQNH